MRGALEYALHLAVELHELLRLGIGQRPQEDGVDHAEHRGVRADAERQRQDRDEAEAGLAPHQAQCVAEIAQH